jgi:uncharacterized protein YkwD
VRVRAGVPTHATTMAAVSALIATSRALAIEPTVAWSGWTASPIPIDPATLSSIEQAALSRCGTGEAGLRSAARAVVERKAHGLPIPELDQIALLQRASGEPHPWARAWVATGTLESSATMANLDAWLGGPGRQERRCAVASATSSDGTRALAVVAIDVLADLAPMPTRARPGQWLSIEARLRVPAWGGEVIVLGPSGAPRSVPTSFDGKAIRARFAPERAGEFAVQIMADVADGRRPILEATVLAGIEAPTQNARSAPGEELPITARDDDEQLAQMVTAARGSVGLRPLTRDPRLDAVARDHAQHMASAHELAHQLDDRGPLERLRAAGVDAADLGENVAHAATVPLAHRSLWASPSHRANLLRRDFDRIGVAVVRDEHGDAWAVETLTGSP